MVTCRCGLPSVLRTSYTRANPGRRFHYCLIRGSRGCGFVAWAAPPPPHPTCPNYSEVSAELERMIRINEDAGKTIAENKRLKVLILMSWMLFVIYVLTH
ncbi:putative transcription factor GRF family [Helianthus debilis subsp. tardiflorus]